MQVLKLAPKVCLVVRPRQSIHTRRGCCAVGRRGYLGGMGIPHHFRSSTSSAILPFAWQSVARVLQDPIFLIVILLVAAAILLLVVPIVSLVSASLQSPETAGTVTLANFRSVLAHPLFAPTVWNTLLLGSGTVVMMLIIAVPFAWLFTRTDLPRKDLLLALVTVNIAIPSFLVAMGYIFLFNPSNGIANLIARKLFGFTIAPFNIYTLGWMIVLQGMALAAPAFFMIVPTLQAIDVTLEEAAAASGVRRRTAALFVVIPLAAPAILAAAAYYFIIAIEIFDYAGMLGMPVRNYVVATWLYLLVNPGFGLPRYGEAAALGLLAAAVSLLLSLLYIAAVRRASRYVVVTGKRRLQQNIPLSRAGKAIAWGLIVAYSIFAVILPLLALLWASGLPFMQVPSYASLSRWSLDAYREAFAQIPPLLCNTVLVMVAVPTVSVALATCVAWLGSRFPTVARRGLDVFVMMAIAVPSIVSALGFLFFGLATYQYIPIYTTAWIVVLAMSTRYLTWANRTVASSLVQVHPEIEEASATSGVRRGPSFVSVLLPTIGPALLFSWFWLALLSLRELTIPIMLARPNTAVLSTAIWGLNSAGNADIAAAMSIILVGMILVLVLIFHRVVRRWAI